MKQQIKVHGLCWNVLRCTCAEKDGGDPEEMGYPPFHKDCVCVVEKDSPAQRRIDWVSYFMKITELVSTRSTCIKRQCGAVLVKDNRIISSGYNGTPSGLAHCEQAGCIRDKLKVPSGKRHELCRGLHAEENAILQAAASNQSVEGSILYSTFSPCVLCAKMLINIKTKKIYATEQYPDSLALEMLEEAKIPVLYIKKGGD